MHITGVVAATGAVTGSNLSGTNTGDQTLPTRASLGIDATDTVTFRDIYAYRAGGTTGVIYLSSDGLHYLYWNGSAFSLSGGSLACSGNVTGTNLSGTNTGDQTSVSGSSGSCTGNAATSSSCSGASASCSGNAATATNVAYSGLTGSVPTWNQNTSGTASNITSYTINQSLGSGNSPTFAGLSLTSAMTLNYAYAGIEIGQQGAAQTPFIDWHSGATNCDYDVRMIAAGGNGSTSQGTMDIWAATTTCHGNFSTTGSLSKGSGSFKIIHPLASKRDTHHLVHSFIEGPKADLIYRGRASLRNGKATVNIDLVSKMTEGTFAVLCRDVQCFTTNETDWHPVKGVVEGNLLFIESQDENSSAVISWLVIGERMDPTIMESDITDDNGSVMVEPLRDLEQEALAEMGRTYKKPLDDTSIRK